MPSALPIAMTALGGESHVARFIYWPTRELPLPSREVPEAEATSNPPAIT
jgi:hypothetical protein